jgi:hypothetical protein
VPTAETKQAERTSRRLIELERSSFMVLIPGVLGGEGTLNFSILHDEAADIN